MFGWIGTLIGILLLILAALFIFIFPSTVEHQPEPYGWNGVIFGFILGIIGFALIFLP